MIADERQKWFLDYPFKLELMGLKDDDDDELLDSPISSISEAGKARENHCKKLIEDLRLSWILVDKNTGKAVNLSSWKPLSVQKSWPYHATYVMQFGCVLPVEESLLPQKLARFIITARFKMTEREECLKWSEISMRIENIEGAHVNGRSSLMILSKALYSQRSANQFKLEEGLRRYDKQKTETMRRRESREALADRLLTFIEITVFVIFYVALRLLV
ncbi:F-BOX PROTEIN-RELATED [Salix purpurea]|uniref:F-BOX PROTEIN-RELATED n=1 Tax=Salix purpurea TaxID=77065 RepID=A0A9Q0VRK0_SALPP|nr:F-BOX PROTEIN-RELATED [Salix purpurea]